MQDLPQVTVLMGGPDAERAVSLDSGRAVAQALREGGRFDVREHVIDDPHETLRVQGVDVFFPALHGPWGEGGPLQRILELTGVPYVGSGPDASSLCIDKWATKQALVDRREFRTPHAAVFAPSELCPLQPPVVLKPVDDGSSVDVFICRNDADVQVGVAAMARRKTILVERLIEGRELTVSILCGRVLPIVEIVPSVSFYDYEAKYRRDDTTYDLEPDLPKVFRDRCETMARVAFEALGCRDLARIDFMCDDTGPWLLEVNTMPGFTSHSLLPKAASAAGMSFVEVCETLVDAALARGRRHVGVA